MAPVSKRDPVVPAIFVHLLLFALALGLYLLDRISRFE